MRFVLLGMTLLFGILLGIPYTVQAQSCQNPGIFGCFEVGFPGIATDKDSIDTFAKGTDPLVTFSGRVATVIVGIIVAIGFIVIVAGGYVYMTAGGSAERVGTAKTMIGSALLGILLALLAFTILNTISPQFTTPIEPTIGDTSQDCRDQCRDTCGFNAQCYDFCVENNCA